MWRNYAGTFTPKRSSKGRPSPLSHSDNLFEVGEDGLLASPSAHSKAHRRSGLVNSTSYSSSSPALHPDNLQGNPSEAIQKSVVLPSRETFSSATTTREASASDSSRPPTTISFVRKHRGSLPPGTEPVRINSSRVGVVPPGFASEAKRDSLLVETSVSLPGGAVVPIERLKTPPPPPPKPTSMATVNDPNKTVSDQINYYYLLKKSFLLKQPTINFSMAARKKAVGLVKQASGLSSTAPNTSMFEPDTRSHRPAPEMPTTEGIEYPRAASWSSSTVAEILKDSIGRQVFRCFLFEALAEENLLFVESIEKLKKEKVPEKIKTGIIDLLEQYGSYINLSSVSMSKLRQASQSDTPDPKSIEVAHKEIYKLLENDQFPRFRRSTIYLNFLEKLLPRSYAEKWTTSFDALLGNQVGRHHFRQYLFSVHAEENLRFWESVVEFRGMKNKSTAMLNMGRTIQQQFLREGAHNEVFLPFGLRQRVEKKIKEKDVDETLFDDAVKHVEQILKNDPYVRFLQSKDYKELLAKLR
uniref:RGS domain-containing protein n=1 Tax=Ditylenchus dipsaci TaxID=166011 RepID=A0A915DYL2_9BILA